MTTASRRRRLTLMHTATRRRATSYAVLGAGVHVAPWCSRSGAPVLLGVGHDGALAAPPAAVENPRRLGVIMMRLWEAVDTTRTAERVAARTDVPQLVDRVRELEAAVAELRAEVEAYRPIVDAAERWRAAGCAAAPVKHAVAVALIEAVDSLWRAEGVVA